MHYELKDKIDVMAYEPGYVATNLINMKNSDASFFFITTESAANTAFRDLGIRESSHGSWSHFITGYFLSWWGNLGKKPSGRALAN